MPINNYIKWPAERIRQDENNRLVTDLQITTWNGKADADHNHDDKYIPLSGTVALTGSIYPVEGETGIAIGNPAKLFEMMAAKVFYAGGSSPKVQISGISDNGYITINGKNRSGEDIGCQIQPSPDSSSNSICYLPVNSGTFALTKDIPESLKNPNALSIQLNGGDATEYDGSAAKSIDITPASIGAAASGDLDNYIPLSGSTSINGNLAPSKNTFALGILSNPWATIFTRTFQLVDSNRVRFDIYPIGDFAQFKLYDSKSDYHITIDPEILTGAMSANVHIQIPVKDGTLALLNDIPTTLPASDVKDWAKADIKPSYTFAEITEKPDTFTPAAHKHKDEDIESISASKITGTISIENIPKAALERCVPVTNDEARFALTTDTVQLGDTVKVENTGLMYLVVDESKLNSEDGYQPYTAAAAASVPWTGVTGKPEKFTPDTHTHTISEVTDLQTKRHSFSQE